MAIKASPPVAILFGAGENIGQAVTRRFVQAGFKVAAVSRSIANGLSEDGSVLTIQADLTHSSQIPNVFRTLRQTWDTFPSVIIWNAARRSFAPDKSNIFSVPLVELGADFDIANSSPWVAAFEAVKNWREGEPAVFIYTGNLLAKAIAPAPDFTTLGLAKRAASYWVEDADRIFSHKGWRFYYADERNAQGGPAGNPPGAASHAEMYLKLARGNAELPSYLTFTDGEYHEF